MDLLAYLLNVTRLRFCWFVMTHIVYANTCFSTGITSVSSSEEFCVE